MAVIVLCSAAGSPGVTTTALGLAMSWPRPVLLVEADPTGGSGLLAGYFRGIRPYETGLIELALSPVDLADALSEVARPIDGTGVSFVAGTRSHTQAAGLRDLWEPLAQVLADLEDAGQDAIVDAGRLGLAGFAEPLLAVADLTVLVTRTTLPALSAARSWADTLRRTAATSWRAPVVLLVGEGQPYRRAEITKVLGLPVLAAVADDPRAAAVFHRGEAPPRRFETGPVARSLHASVEAITATLARRRTELTPEVTP
jgi:hypothetical protein